VLFQGIPYCILEENVIAKITQTKTYLCRADWGNPSSLERNFDSPFWEILNIFDVQYVTTILSFFPEKRLKSKIYFIFWELPTAFSCVVYRTKYSDA